MNVDPAVVDGFVAAAHQVVAYGLTRCSSGNLSYRLDEGHILVKGHGAWLGELTAAGVTVCRLADGTPVDGGRPSVEIGFHAGVLRARRDINVVLHFQSPYATVLACREPAVQDYGAIPEVAYYLGAIADVPYQHGGSGELAEAVVGALREKNLAQLWNHGQVTVGRTYEEALQRAAFFELACQVIVCNGAQFRGLGAEAERELRARGKV